MHDTELPERYQTSWSTARLSAVTATTRTYGKIGRLQRDELEFFAAAGMRHVVESGRVLARKGCAVADVHLIERGAAAVLGELGERRPILSLTLDGELCCAVPALLGQAAPWDVVTVAKSSITSLPADDFVTAVRDRWADRWGTRILTWLAEVGGQNDCLERRELDEEVAAVLLHRQASATSASCQALADVLDVGPRAIRRIMNEFAERGAVRLIDDEVSVTNPEILRALSA